MFCFRKYLIIPLLGLLAVCCAPERTVVIISTNDIHSSINPFPALATLVEDYRAEYPGAVLLVDAGDRWTGNPYVDMAPEMYKPIVELMEELGYDVVTFGNHEWDNGINLLAKRTSELTAAKVLSNADASGTVMAAYDDRIVVEVDGLRIGFIGLITNFVNGHPDGQEENFGGMQFSDPWDAAAEYSWMADSVDLYVAVTHIGYTEDSLLAVRRPEIDLILGGHSHNVIPEGKKINRTVVTQTGKSLKYAGITKITHRNGRITGVDNRLVELDTIAPSPRYATMVARYYDEPAMKVEIGTAETTLGKIALMNLFTDAMRIGAGADFAFYNMGGMRLDSISGGPVILADVYAAEPFGNVPVVVNMTLEEIAELIIKKFNSEGKESHSLDLYPSGMRYKVITDGEGNATDIFFDFTCAPAEDYTFRVALSNYVSGVYDFSRRGQGEPMTIRIADLGKNYIIGQGSITPDNNNRVVIE